MIVINARFLTQELRGVQRFAEQVCLALRELRDDLVFVCPPGIRMQATAQALGAHVIGRHGGHLWEQWDLPRYLARQGHPLLLSLCATAPLFYRNQLATHHDITYVRHPESYSRAFRTSYRLMTPLLLRAAHGLITVSQFSRREISEHYRYPSERILVVANAVSGAFQPGEPLQAEPSYLLAVSSPSAHKNFARMISAFLALENMDHVELRIVGAANGIFADPSLQQQAAGDGRIRFLGRLSDEELIAQYQGATAFVFPSLYEGFGIPPLEAQACGCPVLAANAASIPEVLQSSALYFDPLDTEHMARAMSLVLSNLTLRQHLRTLGLQNVARFSWEASARRISERIDSLLQNPQGQHPTHNEEKPHLQRR
ncbi:glycosyltransferase family 4 protein [Pseudomonas typographi]|uniref:Glycosyltransferase family 4 protein n=1 Tax=Pseudomonas typographi TaxID=2715964 RepID=A0ABR7YVK9_9PSED|nr:glycosyltransferase family 1 protein [Pseudomonas typographi]MBD1552160.1 glycosyltransferase family 4 protein [Pseudomonas typographi]MBD1585132.1 glycosyltransferase family 4 protein [Pseudomonas typographi]MBD1597179.1 glycosyltransferase family 4 protein [Pseudomonas typographi]